MAEGTITSITKETVGKSQGFRLVLREPEVLARATRLFNRIWHKVNVEITEDSVRAWVFVPADNISVELELRPTAFESYEVAEKQQFSIDADELERVLRRLKDAEALEMALKDEELHLIAGPGRSYSTDVSRTIDAEPEVESLDPAVTVVVSSKEFQDVLGDCGLMDRDVEVTTQEDGLHFLSTSSAGDVEACMQIEVASVDPQASAGGVTATYAVDTLGMAAAAADEYVTLRYGTDTMIEILSGREGHWLLRVILPSVIEPRQGRL